MDARGKWEMEVWEEEVTLLRNEASFDQEIFRCQSGMLGKTRQHSRTNLFAIMKRKNEVWLAFRAQNSVRANSPDLAPSNVLKCLKYLARLGRRPLAHAGTAKAALASMSSPAST